MKIISALRSGFLRSARSWKAALIITLALLFLISFFTIPFKGVLKSSLGSSAVAGQLVRDFNPDIVSDLSEALKNYLRGLSSGLFMVITAGMLFFTFFSGGLFSYMKAGQGKFSVARFFRASAEYFWPFLAISLIISTMLGFFISILSGIVVGITMAADAVSLMETGIMRVTFIAFSAFVLAVFFLVADYSRAHFSAVADSSVFKAIGYGFKMTFGSFVSSVSMMFILIIIQVLFIWVMTWLVISWKPATGFALFMMLISAQLLLFIRIFLRLWRYASVISLMESLEQDTVTTPRVTVNDHTSFENIPSA